MAKPKYIKIPVNSENDEIYFRGLLLRYITHVEQVTGNDLIDFGIGSLGLKEVGFSDDEIKDLKILNKERKFKRY